MTHEGAGEHKFLIYLLIYSNKFPANNKFGLVVLLNVMNKVT